MVNSHLTFESKNSMMYLTEKLDIYFKLVASTFNALHPSHVNETKLNYYACFN